MGSAAVRAAFDELEDRLHEYLDNVELIVRKGSDESRLSLVAVEVPTLLALARALIREHRPDSAGHCASCGHRWRRWWLIREPWPCAVVRTAHQYMTNPDRVLAVCGMPDPTDDD
ncbi:hypothetical protein LX15_000418 [Streptoalloteichus tenebrarius]|uniref:Uncharacterized protein n=1 Tax=Streptoalloteichus tenebrarius (strain ATCC 17920 / DSM 40477 / JCM 4838 / CBS 697.72 / NBRC 16177 / NCIMB 11028 / NRRL B-12390 / A12253. 1 / ISP 5477) TaxID=1933 RepID=A0ABT1HMK9_STRSD|nr:hypothetical protein [Streptoalloteichus tenebrarius]MCP2256735.1 hypothetical protein [Streptoalloteichus tenebrarius]BFF00363.1 hypothetical protein GCM10020241_20380 [Streptoalloteichus tenebrarius]